MKHHFPIILTTLALTWISGQINAESYRYASESATSAEHADDRAYSAAEEVTPGSGDARPFNLSFSGDGMVAKTKLERNRHHDWDNTCHNRFQYAEAFAELGFIFYYDPCNTEGLSLTLDYSFVDFDWKTNPYFCQQYFHTATLALGGFSKRFNDWTWKAQAAVNVDAHTWNFNQYMTLDFILWGRYQYCNNIGIHMGVLVETGMKIDRVYPIVGADWQATKAFKLSLVYPVDVAATYQFNTNWSVQAAGRFFSSRHRTSQHAFVPKSVFAYRSAGGEFAINYDTNSWFFANIHAGYTFAGTITLGDQHYKHKQHYDVDPAPYVGGELAFKF